MSVQSVLKQMGLLEKILSLLLRSSMELCCSTRLGTRMLSMWGAVWHYAAPPDLELVCLACGEQYGTMLLHPTWTLNKSKKKIIKQSPSSGQISPCKG
jgi:hypothetical protein